MAKLERSAQPQEHPFDDAEPIKPAQRILSHEIHTGRSEMERPTLGLLISGLSAGLDVSFSMLLIAIVRTRMGGDFSPAVVELFVALAYTLGFIFVVLGRSELFTEHTTLAVLPVLNGSKPISALLRLWSLVYISNLVGVAIFMAIFTVLGPAMHLVEPAIFGEIASTVIEHRWWVILLSGIFAGWLMGLLSWLVAASRDTISQIAVILLVTATIGYAHLHHSIVGSAEVLGGLFAGQGISLGDYGYFLLWATAGNIVGGAVFVALVKYGHIVYGKDKAT